MNTVSVLIKIIGPDNPQMQQEISGSVDALCTMILPKTMKATLKAGVEDTFANRVDIDVVTQFASLMYSVVNLNAEIFILAPSFDQCINLFS